MDVSEQTWQHEVIERSAEVPVVVDFWADWCGPCKTLTPVLEEAVAAREGKVALAEVDVDANKELAAQFDVRGIPAVKAFRNGRVVSEFVGAKPPAFVSSWLDELTKPPLVESLRGREDLADVVASLDQGDHSRAFELLLERVAGSTDGARDEAKEILVGLFQELGQDDPLVAQYRRRLATLLY